jgi:hypothetical protein
MPPTVKPDWNAYDAIDLRALALDELQNPSGAYDGPISKAGHQFDHLFRDIDADPIFPSAGAPPGVNDAMTNNRRNNNLAVRGQDQDPDPDQPDRSVPSAEECAKMVEILADGLAAYDDENETSEHNAFMQALAQLIQAHHNSGNGDQYSTAPSSAGPPPSYNSSAPYARLRSSTSGDRRRRNGARDRALAADSNSAVAQLNLSSFYKRFPGTRNIRFGGDGR